MHWPGLLWELLNLSLLSCPFTISLNLLRFRRNMNQNFLPPIPTEPGLLGPVLKGVSLEGVASVLWSDDCFCIRRDLNIEIYLLRFSIAPWIPYCMIYFPPCLRKIQKIYIWFRGKIMRKIYHSSGGFKGWKFIRDNHCLLLMTIRKELNYQMKIFWSGVKAVEVEKVLILTGLRGPGWLE